MYLSRVMLNIDRRETMRALASPQLLHGAVEHSFSGNRERKLWRVDWLGNNCYLLVLSEERPDFTYIAKEFGYSGIGRFETKEYSSLLVRLKVGQIWQFRLCANPTRSSFKEKNAASGRGKVFAHVTHEQQKQWLLAKEESCGFKLKEDAFDVVYTQWKKFRKGSDGNREVAFLMATYEGILTVSDLKRFKQTLLTGIGREKAYGCGLLTIARCAGDHNA